MKTTSCRLKLNGTWSLKYANHTSLLSEKWIEPDDKELSAPLLCCINTLQKTDYPEISATVPGNFELDFFHAGLCDDPYFGTNVIALQKYESYHMFYYRHFFYENSFDNPFLILEGIDTASEIYINGKLLLCTDNMFIEYNAPLSEYLTKGFNEIVIHIKPAILYAKKYPKYEGMFSLKYSYDALQLRKPASMFGWDIAPRMISGGIWRDIYIENRKKIALSDIFLFTSSVDPKNGTAKISVVAEIMGNSDFTNCRLCLKGKCKSSEFKITRQIHSLKDNFEFSISDCLLWNPVNYGEPNLYEIHAELICEEKPVDSKSFHFGIRTVILDRTEEHGGKFDFCLNGNKVFIMGTNWVPVDAMHSQDKTRIKKILPLLHDLGCNMVRCWGGNVYECEELFDYCDSHGIMIWQDFGMACGVYPRDASFLKRFSEEAVAVIKKYRNHPSLVIWNGDNECDLALSWSGRSESPNDNCITRQLLPEILREYDPSRPFLPSSPYVDDIAFKSRELLSEDHLWGPRDYFKSTFYRDAKAKFASETGYHGCPSPESLRKFLSPEAASSWHTGDFNTVNDEWLAHSSSPELDKNAPFAYRIPLMVSQIKTLFGTVPENIDDFSFSSQISQGEAYKYFIERFRLKKESHGGIIWWNLIDCWPQISDAVVDYYGNKKLAYQYIKNAQKPVILIFDEPDNNGMIKIVADNEYPYEVTMSYTISDLSSERRILSDTVTVPAHSAIPAGNISGREKNFLLAEWEYRSERNILHGRNHFISDPRGSNLKQFKKVLERAGIIPINRV